MPQYGHPKASLLQAEQSQLSQYFLTAEFSIPTIHLVPPLNKLFPSGDRSPSGWDLTSTGRDTEMGQQTDWKETFQRHSSAPSFPTEHPVMQTQQVTPLPRSHHATTRPLGKTQVNPSKAEQCWCSEKAEDLATTRKSCSLSVCLEPPKPFLVQTFDG